MDSSGLTFFVLFDGFLFSVGMAKRLSMVDLEEKWWLDTLQYLPGNGYTPITPKGNHIKGTYEEVLAAAMDLIQEAAGEFRERD